MVIQKKVIFIKLVLILPDSCKSAISRSSSLITCLKTSIFVSTNNERTLSISATSCEKFSPLSTAFVRVSVGDSRLSVDLFMVKCGGRVAKLRLSVFLIAY